MTRRARVQELVCRKVGMSVREWELRVTRRVERVGSGIWGVLVEGRWWVGKWSAGGGGDIFLLFLSLIQMVDIGGGRICFLYQEDALWDGFRVRSCVPDDDRGGRDYSCFFAWPRADGRALCFV